jgi:hypothetical protein
VIAGAHPSVILNDIVQRAKSGHRIGAVVADWVSIADVEGILPCALKSNGESTDPDAVNVGTPIGARGGNSWDDQAESGSGNGEENAFDAHGGPIFRSEILMRIKRLTWRSFMYFAE